MAFQSRGLAKRLGLMVLLDGFWYAVLPTRSFACTCPEPGSPSWAKAKSAVVFSGEVVAVREFERGDGTWHTMDPTTVEFKVQTLWRGNGYQTTYIATPRSGASCGFTFMEGIEYVVYSRDGRNISLCSRTRPLSEAPPDLAALGLGQPPAVGTMAPVPLVSAYQEDEGDGLWPYATALSLLLLILGGAWMGLRKRRADMR